MRNSILAVAAGCCAVALVPILASAQPSGTTYSAGGRNRTIQSRATNSSTTRFMGGGSAKTTYNPYTRVSTTTYSDGTSVRTLRTPATRSLGTMYSRGCTAPSPYKRYGR